MEDRIMTEKNRKKSRDESDVRDLHETDSETVADDTTVSDDTDSITEPESPEETAGVTPENDATSDATNERYIRLAAEYDNYRKRVAKEREQLYQMATGDIMKEMLPVLDNLDRATEHRNSETSLEEYVSGIALIEDQLRTVLSHAGLEVMEVVGQPFDPTLHDAIMQMESEEYDSGIVVQEVEKGYLLRDRVIRHAKVVVAK